MLYPAMSELLKNVDSRYLLVNVVAHRARQLSIESELTHEPLEEKPVTLAIREVAAGYAAEIMRRLREHEYDPQTMWLWVVGGGGCLLRHFGEFDRDRVTIIDNIHANAEGYEYLAERRLRREGAAG